MLLLYGASGGLWRGDWQPLAGRQRRAAAW